MLFDDEYPFESAIFNGPSKCIALPLKSYISLKDLWVPSELLPSRSKFLDSNRNKSYVFHTLEKKENVESLSVYFEDSEKSLPDKGVLGNPLYTGLSTQNSTSIIDKQDSTELLYKDDSDDSVNLNKNQLDNDEQITNSFEVNNKTHPSEKSFSNEAVTEPSVTYQKFERDHVEQVDFLDIINDEELLYSVTSDIYTNKGSAEYLFASQTQPKEKCDNGLQCMSPQTISKDVTEVVKSEQCPGEPVIELPIAYQRPALKDSKKKQKNQKKKKTTLKKNVQLGDFLQTANSDGYDDLPKKDEFYENLVRQGICLPPEILSSEFNEPRYGQLDEEFFGISEKSHPKEESYGFHHQSCSEALFEQSMLNEKRLEMEQVATNPGNDIPTTTLVLENVSKEITKENIESLFISEGYGEIKELTLESCGKFIKAYVKLILDCEVIDWLIECLNESEPFGALGGVVKCYKL